MKLPHPLRALSVTVWFVSCFGIGTASARPLDREVPIVQYTDLHAPALLSSPGVFGAAAVETVYFGGTVWAADSARWEAVRNSMWTFDSGVGSHYNHSVAGTDPFKTPSLHAYMEGWAGVDRTAPGISYFRRQPTTVFPNGGGNCVITGSWSMWAGVLSTEAPYLCYAGGAGYGNNWHICIEHSFTYSGTGNVTFQYSYKNDTEDGFDFTTVYVDTTGNGNNVTLAQYTAAVTGTGLHTLVPHTNLRSSAGPIKLRFCVDSDAANSDEDGVYTTGCGAFALDALSVTGGGISYTNGFETDSGGWTVGPPTPGFGGDWSDLVHVNDLPAPMINCLCGVQDTVLVLQNLSGGHGLKQNNFAASPWIDLKRAGLLNLPTKFMEMDMYADMPLLNYTYTEFFVQWYPYTCPDGGKVMRSPWTTDGVSHYFGSVPTCTQPGGAKYKVDLSSIVSLGAEKVRIGLGVHSFCAFYPNCTGQAESTPWFDNVRFGVGGTFASTPPPVISARAFDLPQDVFPENGSLDLNATGRVDAGTIKGGSVPGPGTSLGDTLVVQGASGGAEVWVQFAIRPGPGLSAPALATYLSTVTFVENRRGLAWYTARMDTAEQGGVVAPGSWMTTFHESYPAFSGPDTRKDAGDLDPQGNLSRLANDIFPDNLFTPGTRLNLFYKSKFTAGSLWRIYPDTTGGKYVEMEVMPSSMDAQGGFNCVLYVEHSGDAVTQTLVENGLAVVLPGSSANYEHRRWDRFEVRAPSSHQGTFGRPAGTEYGATLPQVMGYRGILWNTGTSDAFPLTDPDATLLRPWLLLLNQPRVNSLYLSGDGLVTGVEQSYLTDPAALRLLQEVAGVGLNCGTFSASNCPTGSPQDLSACVPVNPAPGAVVSLRPQGGSPEGQGNGCPTNRSFDVLTPLATTEYGALPLAEETYVGPAKSANYASVSRSGVGDYGYKVVTDGFSVHQRRVPGECLNSSTISAAVAERLEEVLDWFGLSAVGAACSDTSLQTGVGDEGQLPPVRTALGAFFPNPLRGGSAGQVAFSLEHAGAARVDILDLQGRVVKSLFAQRAEAGGHIASWDGTDGSGRRVADGVYMVTLTAPGVELGKKLVVLRN